MSKMSMDRARRIIESAEKQQVELRANVQRDGKAQWTSVYKAEHISLEACIHARSAMYEMGRALLGVDFFGVDSYTKPCECRECQP